MLPIPLIADLTTPKLPIDIMYKSSHVVLVCNVDISQEPVNVFPYKIRTRKRILAKWHEWNDWRYIVCLILNYSYSVQFRRLYVILCMAWVDLICVVTRDVTSIFENVTAHLEFRGKFSLFFTSFYVSCKLQYVQLEYLLVSITVFVLFTKLFRLNLRTLLALSSTL